MNNQFFYYLFVIMASHLIVDSIYKYLTWWNKKVPRFGSKVLWSFLTAVVSYIAVADWRLWILPLCILVTHLVVYLFRDALKSCKGFSLFIEELLHLTITLLITWLFFGDHLANAVATDGLSGSLGRLVFVVAGFCTAVLLGAVVIGLRVVPFQKQLESARKKNDTDALFSGFENGGKMIGVLERSLIYIFIMVGEPAAIGFLIAAKSILRFGEIKDSDNRMEAEYIIIGTLMSFLFAVLVGYLTSSLLKVFFA